MKFNGSLRKSNKNFYIENFTGLAFELLIRNLLEKRADFNHAFLKKLNLIDENYEVLTYWDKKRQIDLIVEHNTDRISRIIECKWGNPNDSWIKDLLQKDYKTRDEYQKKHYLFLRSKPTKQMVQIANQCGIDVVSLYDLF